MNTAVGRGIPVALYLAMILIPLVLALERLMFVTLYSTIFKTPPPQALGTSFRQAQSWPPSMSNIRFMTGQMR